MIVAILLIAALILGLLVCFGVPSRVPLDGIAIVCLAAALIIGRGYLT